MTLLFNLYTLLLLHDLQCSSRSKLLALPREGSAQLNDQETSKWKSSLIQSILDKRTS